MLIQIVSNEVLANGARSIEIATEKQVMEIYVGLNFTSMVVKNASHRAHKGIGRTFNGTDGLAQALTAYKSQAVKAMIETAIELAN